MTGGPENLRLASLCRAQAPSKGKSHFCGKPFMSDFVDPGLLSSPEQETQDTGHAHHGQPPISLVSQISLFDGSRTAELSFCRQRAK